MFNCIESGIKNSYFIKLPYEYTVIINESPDMVIYFLAKFIVW